MRLTCTNHLFQEHKLILRAVYVLDAMAERSKIGKMPESADVEKLLRFFSRFADKHHQGKEEAILFPAVKRASEATTAGPLHQMMIEHEEERSLIVAMEGALRTRRNEEFAYSAGRLAAVLSNHIYKEDHILFDLVEKKLTPEVDARVTSEMVSCDDGLGDGKYEFVQIVNELEWKYLSKAA